MLAKCARGKCPNIIRRRGRQKYCSHNCATLDYYHKHKVLTGRIVRVKPRRYDLCNRCRTVLRGVRFEVRTHYDGRYTITIGKACPTCRTVVLRPDWKPVDGVGVCKLNTIFPIEIR